MLEFGTEADSCRGLAKGIAGVVGRAVDTSAGTIELPGIADKVVVEGIGDLARGRFQWRWPPGPRRLALFVVLPVGSWLSVHRYSH